MNWYYAEGNERRGPVSQTEFDALVTQSVIRPETLVWNETLANWTPYSSVAPRRETPSAPWHYSDGQHRWGPISEAELSALGAEGKIQPSTLLWREGMAGWAPYATLQQGHSPTLAPRRPEAPADDGRPRYAGFWIRYIAKGFDNFFINLAGLAITLPVWLASMGLPNTGRDWIIGFLILSLINVVVSCAYHVFFVGSTGSTPGKKILELEIVRADGSPVGYGLALYRWFASFLNYLTLMIGWMVAAWTDEKTGLHDQICGTRVLDHGSRPGQPAGFWIRYCAKSIDNLLLSGFSFVVGFAIGMALIFAAGGSAGNLPTLGRLIGGLCGYVASFAYFTIFVGAKGATPGKQWLGLQIVRMDGSPVSYGLAAGRWFVCVLNYLTLYVGWIMAGVTQEKRGLHDLICDTHVIHVK